jgi:hypothetical protein
MFGPPICAIGDSDSRLKVQFAKFGSPLAAPSIDGFDIRRRDGFASEGARASAQDFAVREHDCAQNYFGIGR